MLIMDNYDFIISREDEDYEGPEIIALAFETKDILELGGFTSQYDDNWGVDTLVEAPLQAILIKKDKSVEEDKTSTFDEKQRENIINTNSIENNTESDSKNNMDDGDFLDIEEIMREVQEDILDEEDFNNDDYAIKVIFDNKREVLFDNIPQKLYEIIRDFDNIWLCEVLNEDRSIDTKISLVSQI